MRYIRTKDGIIEITKDKKHCIAYDKIFELKEDWQKEVIKSADTIEELCDEFVVVHGGKVICQFASKVWNYGEIKSIAIGNDFYGAIWIDKGLIYVAKMNEKGELELL